ncbi:MAG: hemolysin family protein [Candidatus Jidaibacter sp.]|jgi:CBS domain containing-hemolysin-like protein|nr:hemolysin family protein [Candidatus Jidaibacter sp.]
MTKDHDPRQSFLKKLSNSYKAVGKRIKTSIGRANQRKKSKGQESLISEEAQKIVHNIMHFSDLDASDVMVPKLDIIAASNRLSLAELLALFIKEEHSRLPIHGESLDEIEGFIHVKDMIKAISDKKKKSVSTLIRPLIFVPLTIKVTDLLNKMKQAQTHIAIVLDEYGETAGLVTIEDIVEQIVGDIQDEYDSETDNIVQAGEGIYTVDASIKVLALQKLLGITVELNDDQDFDTLAGLMIDHFHYIPTAGEKMIFNNKLALEVLEASNRKIKKVKLSVL